MKKLLVMMLLGAVLVPASASAATRDRTRPTVRYATANGSVVLGARGLAAGPIPTAVTGTATDAGSGIRWVRAYSMPCNTQFSDEGCAYVGPWTDLHRLGGVTKTCSARSRACSWRVVPPTAPGTYWIAVVASDGAGNQGSAGILRIVVV